MSKIMRILAGVLGMAAFYGAYALAALYLVASESIEVRIWTFALMPAVIAVGLGIAWGTIQYGMTQGEKGVKAVFKALGGIALGWMRHWRLLASVGLISAGLYVISTAQRWWISYQTTGFRYILEKHFLTVPTHIGASWSYIIKPERDLLTGFLKEGGLIKVLTGISVGSGQVLGDAHLVEIPVTTPIVSYYFDIGLLLFGLGLIIAGLLFGAYHGIVANNRALQTCGEHTARYHVNALRQAGYDIPEGYEEALARFYKTGDASELRKYE